MATAALRGMSVARRSPSIRIYGSKTDEPALVSVGSSGVGVLDEYFTSLDSGWTGAGVTTRAAITIVK